MKKRQIIGSFIIVPLLLSSLLFIDCARCGAASSTQGNTGNAVNNTHISSDVNESELSSIDGVLDNVSTDAVPGTAVASTPASRTTPAGATPSQPAASTPASTIVAETPIAEAETRSVIDTVPEIVPAQPDPVVPIAQEPVVIVPPPPPPPPPPRSDYPGGFIRITGGTFSMGSNTNERGRSADEAPVRQITLSPFMIAKYPVTQAEYREIMGSNPSHFRGDTLPVEQVDWYSAIEYCNRRSQRENLRTVYTVIVDNEGIRTITWDRQANGYRLPTEAEWEFACRAGTTTAYFTGDEITTNQANFNGSDPHNTHFRGENRQRTIPVNTFTANRFGIYDMTGNVYEWCWDRYAIYRDLGITNNTNTPGPETGILRVLRGGAWNTSMTQLRSAARFRYSPEDTALNNVGFRVARNAN